MTPAPSAPPLPILSRVARGDEAAMKECFARYAALVWSLARRHTPSRGEAEEALQEVFLDLWRSAGRYDASIASETAFIAMIARRRLIDVRRRNKRPTQAPPGEPETEAVDPRPGPDACAEASMAADALGQIRPEQRRAILLACEGYSHAEIAHETGMPVGTVKAHVRRGLMRIRSMLLGVEDVEVPS